MTLLEWEYSVLQQWPDATFEDGPEDVVFAMMGEKTVAACEFDGTVVTELNVDDDPDLISPDDESQAMGEVYSPF